MVWRGGAIAGVPWSPSLPLFHASRMLAPPEQRTAGVLLQLTKQTRFSRRRGNRFLTALRAYWRLLTKERRMLARQPALAFALAALAGSASADPAGGPDRELGPAAPVRAPVVVASAETPRTRQPVPQAQAQAEPAPAKRVRTARVSACRCGGQTPSDN